MAKFLIHVTCGVENPSKAALAFLVAKSAIDEKHEVTMFLAGERDDIRAEFVMLNVLVRLAAEAYKVLCY